NSDDNQTNKAFVSFGFFFFHTIKKFSSPKIQIWFPPPPKLRTGRRADGFDFAHHKLFLL
ncbi:MAG: hypothetical protein AAB759_03255, partial [Patescibacteria group bacterium]